MSDFHIPSYPSIYNLGHKAVQNIFNDEVEITTKIDGSQISVTKIYGNYYARSKGKDLIIDSPEKMFSKAIETIKKLDLRDGWVYRGEFLSVPKHNTLFYSRVPQKYIILFNIERADSDFLSHEEMVEEGKRIGLEVVPLIFRGKIENLEQLKSLLDREAYLGGCKEEGLVLKAYNTFGPDKKVLMAKLVRDDFKELNQKEWKQSNPTQGDIINTLISELKTEARILKAIQHLRESGQLTNSLQDIGPLIKEYQKDIMKEEEDYIKQKLFDYAISKINRAVVSNVPSFYKEYLVKNNINI